MLRKLRFLPITTLICVLSSPVAASAQPATAEIVGTIRDEDELPVPLAPAVVCAVDAGAIALEDGSYRIEIPLGTPAATVPRSDSETDHTACFVGQISRLQRVDTVVERVVPTETPRVEIRNRKLDAQASIVMLGDDFMVRGPCRSAEVKTIVDGMPVSDAFARPTDGVITDHGPARPRGHYQVIAPPALRIASANPTRVKSWEGRACVP